MTSAVQKALEATISKSGKTPENGTGTKSMEGLVIPNPGWNQQQESEGDDGKLKYWLRIKEGFYIKCWWTIRGPCCRSW